MEPATNLLLFNLVTDRDDPILGFTTEWINALAPFFKKIFVVTMSKGVVAVAANVEVYSAGREQGYSELRRLIRFYQITSRILFREKIDMCFVHMITIFAVLFFPFAYVKGIPLVLWYAHGATPLALRCAHRMVNRIVTSSAEGCRLKSSKVKVIGQGINTSVFKPADKHAPKATINLLTVGRLSPVKHCDVLITAIKDLVTTGMNSIRYTLVGGPFLADGPGYAEYLKNLVRAQNLEEVITFSGPIPFYAIPPIYQQADLFLNASSTGSLDKAVLEAMSSGCLVITSNPPYKTVLGELADLLFVPDNNAQLFAAYIKRVLALSPGEKQQLGSRLREIVMHNHSLKRLTELLVHELESTRQQLLKGAP